MSRSAAGPRRPGGRTVPRDTESGDYEDRIKAAYPIHPELFDRLYTDWSTLQRFQSTRGVLRLMSTVIHALWTIGDASPLIMPGSVPLNTVGNGQRTRGNTIVFVAADRQRYEELDAAVREFLAWSHIAGQVNELNLTAQQSAAQAQTRRDQADDAVTGRIIGTHIWALVPEQPVPSAPAVVVAEKVGEGREALAKRVSDRLERGGELTATYGALSIRMALDGPLASEWADGHIRVGTLWDLYTRYPYLDRLRDRAALIAAIRSVLTQITWEREGFALAAT